MDDVITKPIRKQTLIEVVNGRLGENSVQNGSSECDEDYEDSQSQVIDWDSALAEFERNENTFVEIAKVFVGDALKNLQKMQSTYREQDFLKISEMAHGLKWASGLLFFERRNQTLHKLEDKIKSGESDEEIKTIIDRLNKEVFRLRGEFFLSNRLK